MNQYKINAVRELVRNNKKLLSEIRFHKRIFNNLNIAAYIYDINKQRRIWINNNYCDIVGYTKKEIKMLGGNWYTDSFHPDDINFLQERINFFTEKRGNSYSGIYRLKHKSGRWVWCYSNCVVYHQNDKGLPTHLLGIAIDFSDNFKTIKQFNELNKENQRLKNRLKICKLTRRELEITKQITTGQTTNEIAEILNISEHTVNNHRKNIFKKLGFHNIAELVRFAVETGLD